MKNVLSKHTDCQGRNQIKTPRKCDVDPQSFFPEILMKLALSRWNVPVNVLHKRRSVDYTEIHNKNRT